MTPLTIALAALAVLVVPGLLIGATAGARGFLLLAISPLLTVGTVSISTILFSVFGIDWNVAATSVSILIVAGIAAIVGRVLPRTPPTGPPNRRATIATSVALLIAAALGAVQLSIVFGNPENISQTFDAAFHLNGVKYLLETADGSSLHLSGLILPDWRSSFYPAGWHDIVALVVMVTGASVPVAANMVNLVIAAVVWPAGAILFVRFATKDSTPAIIAAGVLSMGFAAFPILPLDFGVLYPYFLALAMLPAALVLALSFTGLVPRTSLHWIVRLLLLAVALAGVGLAQPAIVFAWAALMVPPTLTAVIRRSRLASTRRGAVVPLVLFGIAVGGLAVAWWVIGKMGNTAPWNAYASLPEGVFELLTNSREGTPVAIAVSLLVIVGLVSCLRSRRQMWLAGMWGIAALLFLLAATLGFGDLRNIALGLFYKDPPRLAALLAVVAVPVASIGALAVWTVVSRHIPPRMSRSSRFGEPVIAVAATVLLLAASQGTAQRSAVETAATTYAITDSSPILSTDERTLISRLDEHVPEGDVVVGNPWTGTSFAYVIGDRDVLNPHFNVSSDPLHVAINTKLRDALTDPDVCDAIRDTGAGWVLDFGVYSRDSGGVLDFDSTTDYPGLVDIGDSGAVEEVDRVGDKVLYRITACD